MKLFQCLAGLVTLTGCATTATFEGTTAPPWPVALTADQQQSLDELAQQETPSAFAISPDGDWGFRWGASDVDSAREGALANCNAWVGLGERLCVLYDVNGTRVAPDTVTPQVAQTVYTAFDPGQARSFFGPVRFAHEASDEALGADHDPILADPERLATTPRNAALRSALENSSIVSESTDVVIWFGPEGAEIHNRLPSGDLLIRIFADWHVTQAGVVCLNRGTWSNGNEVGMVCVDIQSAQDGSVQWAWSHNSRLRLRGQWVAGNALQSAAR